MTQNQRATAILKPYQIFDVTPAFEEFDFDTRYDKRHPAIIMLSGPPGSGKTTQLRTMLESKFEGKSKTLQLSAMLYGMMRLCSLPDTYLDYDEFKKLPMGRERLIAASNRFKAVEQDAYAKAALASTTLTGDEILIIDNVGFSHEIDFFAALTDNPLLIELCLPYGMSPEREPASQYFQATDKGSRWPHDSRCSLVSYTTQSLGPRAAQSFMSSIYAKGLLTSLVFERKENAPNISLSAFGRLHSVWKDATETGAVGDLFDQR